MLSFSFFWVFVRVIFELCSVYTYISVILKRYVRVTFMLYSSYIRITLSLSFVGFGLQGTNSGEIFLMLRYLLITENRKVAEICAFKLLAFRRVVILRVQRCGEISVLHSV